MNKRYTLNEYLCVGSIISFLFIFLFILFWEVRDDIKIKNNYMENKLDLNNFNANIENVSSAINNLDIYFQNNKTSIKDILKLENKYQQIFVDSVLFTKTLAKTQDDILRVGIKDEKIIKQISQNNLNEAFEERSNNIYSKFETESSYFNL